MLIIIVMIAGFLAYLLLFSDTASAFPGWISFFSHGIGEALA